MTMQELLGRAAVGGLRNMKDLDARATAWREGTLSVLSSVAAASALDAAEPGSEISQLQDLLAASERCADHVAPREIQCLALGWSLCS